jgi:hypothetical protein
VKLPLCCSAARALACGWRVLVARYTDPRSRQAAGCGDGQGWPSECGAVGPKTSQGLEARGGVAVFSAAPASESVEQK